MMLFLQFIAWVGYWTCVASSFQPAERRFQTLSSSSRALDQRGSSRRAAEATTQVDIRLPSRRTKTVVEKYFDAWNNRDIESALKQFSETAILDDTAFVGVFEGKDAIERHLRLCADAFPDGAQFVVDDVAATPNRVGLRWHVENNGQFVANSRGCSFYNLNATSGLIEMGMDVTELSGKNGDANLAILSVAGKFIEKTGVNVVEKQFEDLTRLPETTKESENAGWFGSLLTTKRLESKTAPERYFEAWNKRDMDSAINVFAEDCQYEDTVFPQPFSNKEELKAHLDKCGEALPTSFSFCVDDIVDAGSKVGVKWHVENGGEPMPFSRGCSFYTVDTSSGLIQQGFDFKEPIAKVAGIKLGFLSLLTKAQAEPVRLVPLGLWAAYMYIVFFSDGILPGANALQLEPRTWQEVADLSLNFFLVSPLLNLPFSPVVHPMLEGVFNLLLSWAALFAGFLSDERRAKPNALPMLPIVIGMQFLTSAFLLPYLAVRTSEKEQPLVYRQDLDTAGRVVGESRLLGPLLGTVGLVSTAWGAIGRFAEFGGWDERLESFGDLLSIDRVGSSFIVDLVIFALFQGWLVDDDLRRRGVDVDGGEFGALRSVAKFVPFFGLAAYLTLRPSLPDNGET